MVGDGLHALLPVGVEIEHGHIDNREVWIVSGPEGNAHLRIVEEMLTIINGFTLLQQETDLDGKLYQVWGIPPTGND